MMPTFGRSRDVSSRTGKGESNASAHPDVEPIDYLEFERVKQNTDQFNAQTWHASSLLKGRLSSFRPQAFDPGPGMVDRLKGQDGALLADDDRKVHIRRGKVKTEAIGFVSAVSVESEYGFVPGTLVVPITRDSVRDVDPRSLHLFRWNPDLERYELVPTTGVNIDGGFVWGRVTRPGEYAVFGIPMPEVLRHNKSIEARYLRPFLLIILRRFAPSGPWASLGPRHLSCCMVDVAIDPANNDRIYAAASDGGVWRLNSVSGYPTSTWSPLTDQQPALVINCLAVSPADSQVIYYVDRGGRLYRSADRGAHWTLTGSTILGNAWRLLAHPGDANTVYVASSSGFWCSTTGGATWTSNAGQTTLRDGDMTDAAMDPDDPSILYLAQRGLGLLKSSNGGNTWQTMLSWTAASSPVGTMIKIAVGGQGNDSNRTVAVKFDQEILVNHRGGRGPMLFGGGPWISRGKQGGTGYGDWCHVIAIDPFDDDVILAGAQQLYRTSNGGVNWNLVVDYYRPHEDQHRIAFDSSQAGVVYAANDGGIFRSSDGGVTWQTDGDDVADRRDLTLGLITCQFYTAGVSGDHAVGDAYHQGLLGASSLVARDWSGIEGHAWEFNNVYGDPIRPGRFYVFGSVLYRRLFPDSGTGPALLQIGPFQPTAIAVDQRASSNTLLAGSSNGQVMRTLDGDSDTPTWNAMPGLSLTGGDRVVSIAFAPSRPQQAYALTAGGRVFTCTDADSVGWSAASSLPSGPGLAITISSTNPDHVFAITPNQVFRSIDGGGVWNPVPGTADHLLPAGINLRSIVAGGSDLYLAAANGVFSSPDEGQHWFSFSEGLPNAEIKELLWTESDLFAVTHGRGLWHRGRYDYIDVPSLRHRIDIEWVIQLWLAIHGGDPAPDIIRERIGRGFDPRISAGR